MSFDGIVIHALVHELAEKLVGGRINKIYQPQETDLLLLVRAGGTNFRLLISANLSFPRLYLTDESFTNPQEPPMFTMLLRKHIENGTILSIKQIGLERIIHIEIASRDELGDQRVLVLVVEIMGRHSNIILLDKERQIILDGIHHVTPSISQYRQVMPGRTYVSPPDPGKLNPLQIDENIFNTVIDTTQDEVERYFVQHFQGVSPLIAKEIVFRSQGTNKAYLWTSFSDLLKSLKNHQYEPMIISGNKTVFTIFPLTHIGGQIERFNSISSCLQAFYQKKAAIELIRQVAQDLLRKLNTEKNKNKKKLEKLEATITEVQKADQYRIWGELITSYQYQIQKGASEAKLPNYYEDDEKPTTIPLDPNITPIENAQVYFKRYSKAKNSDAIVREQIELTKLELQYLDEVISQIELADQNTLVEIREELVEQGYVRNRKKGQKKKKKKADQPRIESYKSSEGFTIYVGKNNMQNDYLTNRLARNTDTWLHTKDIPGSHVVIIGDNFGEATLHEAAMLAAYFSKARNSSLVPVDYTGIRNVRKPSGAKPGYVIYDQQKTLYVTPDEDWIVKLQANK